MVYDAENFNEDVKLATKREMVFRLVDFMESCWEKKYPTYANQELPTSGTNPGTLSLKEDAQVIRSDLARLVEEEGRDVVVVRAKPLPTHGCTTKNLSHSNWHFP